MLTAYRMHRFNASFGVHPGLRGGTAYAHPFTFASRSGFLGESTTQFREPCRLGLGRCLCNIAGLAAKRIQLTNKNLPWLNADEPGLSSDRLVFAPRARSDHPAVAPYKTLLGAVGVVCSNARSTWMTPAHACIVC